MSGGGGSRDGAVDIDRARSVQRKLDRDLVRRLDLDLSLAIEGDGTGCRAECDSLTGVQQRRGFDRDLTEQSRRDRCKQQRTGRSDCHMRARL